MDDYSNGKLIIKVTKLILSKQDNKVQLNLNPIIELSLDNNQKYKTNPSKGMNKYYNKYTKNNRFSFNTTSKNKYMKINIKNKSELADKGKVYGSINIPIFELIKRNNYDISYDIKDRGLFMGRVYLRSTFKSYSNNSDNKMNLFENMNNLNNRIN